MKIHKNLLNTNGEDKIHIDEIADGQGNLIADYVIEQGEDYTKWASGKLECWITIPYIKSVEFTQATNIYTRSQVFTWDFPVNFSSTPAVVDSSTDFAGSTWTSAGVSNAKSATYRYLSFLSPGTRSVKAFGMYAVGRWK